MLQLVTHFGDQNDGGFACGICDVCSPLTCVAQVFRGPSEVETEVAARVLQALRARDGRAVGQMHREVFGDGAVDRRALEHVLGALVRAGDVTLTSDEFEKDGETITFQRAYLTARARAAGPGARESELRMISVPPASGAGRGRGRGARAGRGKRASRGNAGASGATATKRPAREKGAGRQRRASGANRANGASGASGEAAGPLEQALRAWRMAEAKKRRVPAFRILTNRALQEIAAARPRSADELIGVAGVGPSAVEKYGRAILAIVAQR
jgi:DNA topoisomerase-3